MARSERRGPAHRITALALAIAVALALVPRAEAWWSDQWQYRTRISLAAPEGVTTPLRDMPVLMRLHSGVFDFAKAQLSGGDLRFVAADDATPLAYHVERFDSLDELAFVWVKVPQVTPASDQSFIWMYYGNQEAPSAGDAAGSYDVNQAVVYHFDELEGLPADATAYQRNATEFLGWQGAPGVIGNGIGINGVGDHLVVPSSPPLDWSNGLTFSTWLRVEGPLDQAYLLVVPVGEQRLVIGIDQLRITAGVRSPDDSPVAAIVAAELTPAEWHHVAFTIGTDQQATLFLDGAEASSGSLPQPLPPSSGDPWIGGSPEGNHFFAGQLDEVRISTIARAPEWFAALYAAQSQAGTFTAFGLEEAGGGEGGAPLIYLGTVMKNVTVDGWLIIGTLAILGLWSWIVFTNRAILLRLTEKANASFREEFAGLSEIVGMDDKGELYENSSLFHVYATGCQTLRRLLDKAAALQTSGNRLSTKAINTIQANLERGFIEESKRMNAQLVVMTMAITGGPFLGLLGTVWGVMNTFAAMAEVGEANIMAIAPGIASALATTVVGLLVAIPALFGYNYLTGKIKNISAEMSIFIHQFALRVDEDHGDEH
jgi:biopolymer transport protein ExbB